ncbi:MAG: hypothetical protein HQL09_09505 [Nitrospirae bacterium]|nr:hypothetical protein [Nitrospirota bacterium]
MAGALGIRMGGPSSYGGVIVEKPYIGEAGPGQAEGDYVAASEKAINIAGIASLVGVGIAALILTARRIT